jgi:hypothetical protein
MLCAYLSSTTDMAATRVTFEVPRGDGGDEKESSP